MASNLEVNQKLLIDAQKIGKQKKETVNEALREYIQCRKQNEITQLFGHVIYEKE